MIYNETLIRDEKNKLKNYIDNNLIITDDVYDIILSLLNADDALFTKIIEEIKNGNLEFSDFSRLFNDIPTYTSTIETSIDEQEKLYREYSLMYDRLIQLGNESLKLQLNNLALYKKYKKEEDAATQHSITISVSDIEKQNILFSLFTEDIADPFKNYYKSLMLDEIMKNIDNGNNEAVENMLLSLHDYLVPVDFKNIILNDTDREFMRINNIKTEDEMKKIKAVAGFAAAHFEQFEGE